MDFGLPWFVLLLQVATSPCLNGDPLSWNELPVAVCLFGASPMWQDAPARITVKALKWTPMVLRAEVTMV